MIEDSLRLFFWVALLAICVWVALFGIEGLIPQKYLYLAPVEVHASKLPERGSLEWKMDFEGLSFEEATEALEAPGQ